MSFLRVTTPTSFALWPPDDTPPITSRRAEPYWLADCLADEAGSLDWTPRVLQPGEAINLYRWPGAVLRVLPDPEPVATPPPVGERAGSGAGNTAIADGAGPELPGRPGVGEPPSASGSLRPVLFTSIRRIVRSPWRRP